MQRRKFLYKSIAGAAILGAINPGFTFGSELQATKFSLPKLNYDFDALEPYIDKLTMEIHYLKHHDSYVKNLNKEVSSNANLLNLKIEDLLKNVSKYSNAVRNNAGGHYNHSLFWTLISNKTSAPSDQLKLQIETDFESFDKFKEKFSEAAKSRFGSGWAWVILKDKKLHIISTPNQDNPLMDIAEVKGTPLLALDVWEHAYYLKYQNKRPDYISAFWNVVNWNEVNKLFKQS